MFIGGYLSSWDRDPEKLRARPGSGAKMLGGFGPETLLPTSQATVCPGVKWEHTENSKGLF